MTNNDYRSNSFMAFITCLADSPAIPGSAVLKFTFELLSIKDSVADGKSYLRLPDADGKIDEINFEILDADKDESVTEAEVTLIS